MKKIYLALALSLGLFVQLFAQAPPATPAKDHANASDPIAKIREEGMNHSQVMKTLSYLTDVIGPRLTGSPALKRANEWTKDELTRYGLVNGHLEAWGPFGRGWTLKSYSASMVSPQGRQLESFPRAWSPGADIKEAEVVYVNANNMAELERYKGKLKGKIVLNGPKAEVKPHFEPQAIRHDDKALLAMANAGVPKQGAPTENVPMAQQPWVRNAMRQSYFYEQRRLLYKNEGVAFVFTADPQGDGGNIFVQEAVAVQPFDTTNVDNFLNRKTGNLWDLNPPFVLPQAMMAAETYNRLVRMLEAGESVKMNIELKAEFNGEDPMVYNTVAEIPGTDKKDELVMLGGHLDSWQGGTGATDNACGVAVCMEAVRILKAAGLQPRRTIRIALWTGEEQGLFGSEAYVKQHFGEVVPQKNAPAGALTVVKTKPEWDKLAAYFNMDNGAGKVRGIYLQNNEALRPIFRPWLTPFKDLGANTITAENTGGTDHLSFDAVGLPGFQFIQEPLEYETRTHHSTQDVYDRVPPEDMKQASVLMAAFVYNAAMRDEKLPRKPVKIAPEAPIKKK